MHTGLRRPRLSRWPPSRPVAGLALTALAAWEGVQGRYSTASHASILAVVAVVLVVALDAGRGRQRQPSGSWVRDVGRVPLALRTRGRARSAQTAGGLGWVLLIAATAAWDVLTFVVQRHSLPTLSRLFGDVTDHDWGRALVFAAWLVLGVYLALGWLLPRADPRTNHTGPLASKETTG